jgi:23S rRNA (adenine-N6)-dimethyltransferase
VSAHRQRTPRDERRRRLGQNFLRPELAEQLVADAGVQPDELVVEIGPGAGALTLALARRGADVLAVELDPVWAERLRPRARECAPGRVRVVHGDFLRFSLPRSPFRVFGSLPFGDTTAILRRLLDDPAQPLARADLILQWEVARKRSAEPPATLLSASWTPWWTFQLGRRIRASDFSPVPRVDAALLTVRRRQPPLLPDAMAPAWAHFLRAHWPFEGAKKD